MTEQRTGREIHLARRPSGWPQPSDFKLVTTSVRAAPDQVMVRNRFLSVDPYMRGRMSDPASYAAPFALGRVMDGGALGEVVSAPPGGKLARGDFVLHSLGWREYAVGDETRFRPVEPIPGVSLSAFLGALGMPGLTAYVGLLDIGALATGDTVFLSAAAGAVGSMVGQLARLHGAGRVIGSAGSDAKVAHLINDLGFDSAFNYHAGPVGSLLAEATGESGIDVYFDNVGGDHLEAAISALRPHGRVAMCGAISQYNSQVAIPGPSNLALAVWRRLRLQGFMVGDHLDRQPEFMQEVSNAIIAGEIKVDETIADGIETMPEAFIGMLRGTNLGKMVIRLRD